MALERWYYGSDRQGLRQLSASHHVGFNDETDVIRYTDELLNEVATFCPTLENLDGRRARNKPPLTE